MDSNENRRKSKRLSEKWVNSNANHVNHFKTKSKSKSNIKSVKLKENETNVRKSSRNCVKRLNGIIENSSERKYGLRKLAPINWKERLDTRHITNDQKSVDKPKSRNCSKSEDKVISKKEKKIKANNNKINAKISSKVENKFNTESIEGFNHKKHKKRKSNKTCDQQIHTTFRSLNDEVLDSTQKCSDFCQTNSYHNIEQHLPQSEEHTKEEQLSEELSEESIERISYIQYLELQSKSEPKEPSLSLNVIINLLKQRLNKRRIPKKPELNGKKRKLYSCPY